MATYLVLNLLVVAAVALALRVKPHAPRRPWLGTLAALLLLTLVFDNIMIALGLFAYAPDKILGLHVLLAPLEDFMYPLLAALIIPGIWNKLGGAHAKKS